MSVGLQRHVAAKDPTTAFEHAYGKLSLLRELAEEKMDSDRRPGIGKVWEGISYIVREVIEDVNTLNEEIIRLSNPEDARCERDGGAR